MPTPTPPKNPLTTHLNIQLPILQAPMAGGATTPELISTISNTGALGSLAAAYLSPDEIRKTIKKIRLLTNNPFAVNLFIPEKHHATTQQIEQAKKTIQSSCHELNFNLPTIHPPYSPNFEEQLTVIIEESIPIFSFTFGIPSEKWLKKLKQNNITLIGTATTLEEAKTLEAHNIDVIVAQGSEAGGHRGTFLGNPKDALINISTLIPLLAEHIKIPIIAAGGIMNAKGIIASLTLGASAVQMGTAFLCCTESGIHPLYKKCLLNSSADNTSLTRAFSGKLARGITNKFMTRMKSHEDSILDYPIQNTLTKAMRKEAEKQNNIDFMSMWAGQSAHLCQNCSATELIKKLKEEIDEAYTT